LASIPDQFIYQPLLEQFIRPISEGIFSDLALLEGLTQVIQNGNSEFLDENSADGLVQILKILAKRLQETHYQEGGNTLYKLTEVISYLLDAMADINITSLSREKLHGPLYEKLRDLSESNNSALAYQAKYACQALLHVPNDEQPWQSIIRRTLNITGGVLAIASSIRTFDPSQLISAFESFSKAFEGLPEVMKNIQEIFDGCMSISEALKIDSLKPWYSALRYTDLLIQSNKLVELEIFVRKVPCGKKPEFLWGFCKQLERLANTHSDDSIRKKALEFLEDVHKNTADWGPHCPYPQDGQLLSKFSVPLSETPFPTSLLDAVQKRPAVKKDLLKLKQKDLRKLEDNEDKNLNINDIYIDPQGKFSINDTVTFPLLDKVNELLQDPRKKILLLLGDPGA
ncbi:13057_t:CDS:1, partial [Acaulospora colombiana]